MEIIRTGELPARQVYGMACRHLIENLTDDSLPFGSMHCVVEPGKQSTIHNHHERECFFVTRGAGVLRIGQRQAEVKEGDIVRIPPFEDHELFNPYPEPIEYLTFWWEDMDALAKLPSPSSQPRRSLVFSTPPTPNGDLHLGHLSGPYTGADIYRRFLELNGQQAFHVSGRDDNQSYVPRKALDQQRSAQALADEYSACMLKTLSHNEVRIDHFGHPKESPWHVTMVQDIVRRLYAAGHIVEREVPALFCKATGRYLYEAHVRGNCPHCDSESDGNACEQCGRPNDVADLINPRSKYGEAGVERRLVRKLYFRLSEFAEPLARYHREAVMPAHLSSLCQRMIEDGLPDICVSHPVDWGIPVPVEGFTEQRVYVWFEMAAGYLAAAQEMAEKAQLAARNDSGWRQFYCDSESQVVHFFGFDNGYFHALLFPAIYMALDPAIRLPQAFVVNELLNLDGLKFSTSRGHLIWGRDLLRWVPADYVRFYLSMVRPEASKTNFTLRQFIDTIEQEVCGNWESWVQATLARARRLFPTAIPEPGAWSSEQRAYLERVTSLLSDAGRSYQLRDFSPQRICRLAHELMTEARRFADGQVHYEGIRTASDLLRTSVALDLLSLRAFAQMLAPIMPNFAQALHQALEPGRTLSWSDTPRFIAAGTMLGEAPGTFFPPVPEDVHGLGRR